MLKKVLLSSLLGGAVAFAWLSISWMALPYHQMSVSALQNESAVTEVIKMSAGKPGIYYSRAMDGRPQPDNAEQAKDADQAATPASAPASASPTEGAVANEAATQAERPAIFISYSASKPSMVTQMLTSYGTHVLGALLLSLMMLFVARASLVARVSFGMLFAAALAVLATAPLYVWWQFDLTFLTLDLIDYFIGWTLAGMVIAMMIKRSGDR